MQQNCDYSLGSMTANFWLVYIFLSQSQTWNL